MASDESRRKTVTRKNATFGAGCFWCIEAVFDEIEGVTHVTSGYSGGDPEHPTYEQVCTGTTGHAEVCQIEYDPSRVSYIQLLEVFWKIHDPTTPNRQGPDVGTQYRSVIFTHDEQQKTLAGDVKTQLDRSGTWSDPIVTEIVPFKAFYPAEEKHRDYFARNPKQSYCALVIRPKMEKFRKAFAELLKKKR